MADLAEITTTAAPAEPRGTAYAATGAAAGFRPRLVRNVLDRVLGGVCGSIGAHLRVSAWWLRLGWLLFTLAEPTLGVFAYLLLWLIMPAPTLADLPDSDRPRPARAEGTLLLGLGAIVLGIATLAAQFGFWQGKQGDLLLPILLALTGLVLFVRQFWKGG